MRKLKIDDPLDAFAVHGACGLWGVWAVGLFAHQAYSYAPAEGHSLRDDGNGGDLGADAGLLMPGTRGMLFLTQLVVPLIEIVWVVTTSFILFSVLKVTRLLRVSPEEEAAGMDVSKHGGSACAARPDRAGRHVRGRRDPSDEKRVCVCGSVSAGGARPPRLRAGQAGRRHVR